MFILVFSTSLLLDRYRTNRIDDSPNGGDARLRRYLSPDEIKDFDSGKWRVRFVKYVYHLTNSELMNIFRSKDDSSLSYNSVWRPLVPVVEDSPLALCDRRSVASSDMVECDKIHDGHVGEGLYLKHRPEHRWYWLPNQTSDEVLMFITWDSKEDPLYPGMFTRNYFELDADKSIVGPPHAAFDDPLPRKAPAPRESIEVRFIVINHI